MCVRTLLTCPIVTCTRPSSMSMNLLAGTLFVYSTNGSTTSFSIVGAGVHRRTPLVTSRCNVLSQSVFIRPQAFGICAHMYCVDASNIWGVIGALSGTFKKRANPLPV